jgi:cell division FtsZ-interacting protein ZapD
VIELNITIDESYFEVTLRTKLGQQYERALAVFQKFGQQKALDVVQILVHAADENRETEILKDLERQMKKTSFDRSDLEEINKTIERLKVELGI